MPRRSSDSAKATRDEMRERMHALGLSLPLIATEMGRRFSLRPRIAWRHALGWPQWKVAQRYRTLHNERISDNRISEHETWPHGGAKPSLDYLVKLAATYGHGCTPGHLIDLADLEGLEPAERRVFASVLHPSLASMHAEVSQALTRRVDPGQVGVRPLWLPELEDGH